MPLTPVAHTYSCRYKFNEHKRTENKIKCILLTSYIDRQVKENAITEKRQFRGENNSTWSVQVYRWSYQRVATLDLIIYVILLDLEHWAASCLKTKLVKITTITLYRVKWNKLSVERGFSVHFTYRKEIGRVLVRQRTSNPTIWVRARGLAKATL